MSNKMLYQVWKVNPKGEGAKHEVFTVPDGLDGDAAVAYAATLNAKNDGFQYTVSLLQLASVPAPDGATPKNPTGDPDLTPDAIIQAAAAQQVAVDDAVSSLSADPVLTASPEKL